MSQFIAVKAGDRTEEAGPHFPRVLRAGVLVTAR